jgi:hypothetical protein
MEVTSDHYFFFLRLDRRRPELKSANLVARFN